jgi:hypothetical protein
MKIETDREILNNDVEIYEGENLECFIRRHWIELLPKIIFPILMIIICIGLFVYRAMGGEFVQQGGGAQNPFDVVNIILAGFVLATVLFILASRSRTPENKRFRQALTMVALIMVGVFYFRYLGGRLFYFEPADASAQLLDPINIALLIIAVLGVAFTIYLYMEWYDDYLILTDQRVIAWHQVVFGRHSQNQISIDDIQSVNSSLKTYLQYWLNYGNITITSASFGQQLEFRNASSPVAMSRRIMGRVSAYRGQVHSENVHSTLIKSVFEAPTPKAKPAAQEAAPPSSFLMRVVDSVRQWFTKVFEENPKQKPDGSIVWRPHQVFVLLALIKPVGSLLIMLVALFFLNGLFPLAIPALVMGILLLVLVGLAWAAYEVEDVLNEEYILMNDKIVDVEKKPFGPEDQNTAGLTSLQNVKFKTSLIGRMLGYGDVLIDTAGSGKQLTFHGVPAPKDVVSKINEYQRKYKEGEQLRNMRQTLDLLKQYHHHEKHSEFVDTIVASRVAPQSPQLVEEPVPAAPDAANHEGNGGPPTDGGGGGDSSDAAPPTSGKPDDATLDMGQQDAPETIDQQQLLDELLSQRVSSPRTAG